MAEDPKVDDDALREASGGSKKIIAIAAVASVLVGALGAGITFWLVSGKAPPNGEESSKDEGPKTENVQGKVDDSQSDSHGAAKMPAEGEAKPTGHDKDGKSTKKDGGHEEPKEGKKEEAESGGHGTKKDADDGRGNSKEKVKDNSGHASGKGEKEKEEKVDFDFGSTYSLKPFHVNLGNPLENRYMRLELALEYRSGNAQLKEIEARLPQLRDAILAVASRKSRDFLLGPDGKDQLRLEILSRVNQYMERKIEAVFITDLLIE